MVRTVYILMIQRLLSDRWRRYFEGSFHHQLKENKKFSKRNITQHFISLQN